MKAYKTNTSYCILIIFTWSLMLFSCREDETTSTTSNDALQVYLQADRKSVV